MTKKSRVVKLLIEAKRLISKRGGWTQGSYARNADGESVLPQLTDACSFCALGALSHTRRFGQDFDYEIESKAERYLQRCLDPSFKKSVPTFNDSPKRRKREVLQLFDQAIALASKPRLASAKG